MKGNPIAAILKDTNTLISIEQVTQTGLKCNCVCYDCREPLEAVLNTPYRKHFRHHNSSNCNPTPESWLHLMAKVILLQNNRIMIPGKGMVNYSNPVAEVHCNDVVPDATLTIDGKPLYVEIVVTNPLSAVKIEKYRMQNAWVLVIRLEEMIDEETLKYLVLEDDDVRHLLTYEVTSETTPVWKVVVGFVLGGLVLCGGISKRKN